MYILSINFSDENGFKKPWIMVQYIMNYYMKYYSLEKIYESYDIIAIIYVAFLSNIEIMLLLGLHTAKDEAVRYHNRYRRNDTVFYRYCYRFLELR